MKIISSHFLWKKRPKFTFRHTSVCLSVQSHQHYKLQILVQVLPVVVLKIQTQTSDFRVKPVKGTVLRVERLATIYRTFNTHYSEFINHV
jgi:hypothetical protein